MSTYWGLHCFTDNDSSDHYLNHGEAVLRGLIQAWPSIKHVLDVGHGWIDVRVMGWGDEPIAWLEIHDGHDLGIESEYGEVEAVRQEVRQEA